ncbi:MAG: hypothetical protein WBX22_22670 [Silvibacterium sp.]
MVISKYHNEPHSINSVDGPGIAMLFHLVDYFSEVLVRQQDCVVKPIDDVSEDLDFAIQGPSRRVSVEHEMKPSIQSGKAVHLFL